VKIGAVKIRTLEVGGVQVGTFKFGVAQIVVAQPSVGTPGYLLDIAVIASSRAAVEASTVPNARRGFQRSPLSRLLVRVGA
jgi:hypothetical protein